MRKETKTRRFLRILKPILIFPGVLLALQVIPLLLMVLTFSGWLGPDRIPFRRDTIPKLNGHFGVTVSDPVNMHDPLLAEQGYSFSHIIVPKNVEFAEIYYTDADPDTVAVAFAYGIP